MLHSQPEQASGPSGASPFDRPGGSTRTDGPPEPATEPHVPGDPAGRPSTAADQPTLHEFLTRLVSDPQARSAFESDPRASLDGAGLGDLTATDVLQGASLVLDYAPVEVVQEYGRSVQSSVEMFATSTQHVAINQLHPASEHLLQEATEPSMLNNDSSKPDYSAEGDTDAQMSQQQGQETNVDISHEHSIEQNDSHNLISMHHIGNGDVLSGNAAGVVGNTVNHSSTTVGDTVNNTVNSVTSSVDNTVNTTADVATGAPSAVEHTVSNVTADLSAGQLPVDDVTSVASDATAVAGKVAGGVPAVGNVTGDVTGSVGVGEQATTLAAPTDVVSGVAGGALNAPVETATGVTGSALNAPVETATGVAGGALDAPVDAVSGVAGGTPVDAVSGVAGGGALNAPMETVTGVAGGALDAPVETVTGAADSAAGGAAGGAVEQVQGLAGGVTGGAVGSAVGQVQDVAGGATSDLPLDLL